MNYGSNSGSVSVLLGYGNGTFRTAVNYTVRNNPYSLTIGDFNGDGKEDLVAGNAGSNNVSILPGNGDGTFQVPANFAVGTQPSSVAVGDFNGDGKQDIATGNYSSRNVSVLLNSCVVIETQTPTITVTGTPPTVTSTPTYTPTYASYGDIYYHANSQPHMRTYTYRRALCNVMWMVEPPTAVGLVASNTALRIPCIAASPYTAMETYTWTWLLIVEAWAQYASSSFQVSLPPVTRLSMATSNAPGVRSQYLWYRIRLVGQMFPGQPLDSQTVPTSMCIQPTATSTVTRTTTPPTTTNTPTPTFTPTLGPCVQTIQEGFESDTLGIFASGGSPGWGAVTSDAHVGMHSAFARDVGYVSDQQLTLGNPIFVPANASQATLSFWHRYEFEPGNDYWGFDGGVLELSTDSGTSWIDGEGFITSGHYLGLLVWACSSANPLAGREAWTGSSGGWHQVVVNLLTFRGQILLLRFRLGTDQ